ncbi:MAG TPA: endospore germination permease [Limnochordia bacterium]|nr:endospore germination permease [Limnochordia bacterium]
MIRPPDAQVTPGQLGTMVLVMIASLGTLYLPAATSDTALHDAWVSVFISGLFGFLVLGLIIALSRRFPNETLIQYAVQILGPVGGKALGLLFIMSSFFWVAVVMRAFADFVLTTSLPRTPISVILVMIVAVSAAGARHGLEVIGRLSYLLTPIALTIIAVVMSFGLTKMDVNDLRPVLGHGWLPALRGSIEGLGFFGSIVVFGMFMSSATDAARAERAVVGMFTLTLLILTLGTLGVNAAFGNVSGTFTYPFFAFARVASTGPVAFRADAFIVALEFLGFLAKSVIWTFGTSYALAQWFELDDHRSLVLPLVSGAVALSLIAFPGSAVFRAWIAYALPFFAVSLQLGIPALLYAVAALRGRRAQAVVTPDA